MSTPATVADKWMQAGIEADEEGRRLGQKAKERKLDAGYFFCRARKELKNGDWGEFVLRYAHKISDRTIRRYCEFTLEALAQAKLENPKVADGEKLLAIAKTMRLDSPRAYIALARDLGEFRMFGEYDEVRYATNKRKSQDQLELTFSYETVVEQLSGIDRAANAKKLSDAALQQLKDKCSFTADWCDQQLAAREQQKSKTLQLLQ